MAVAPSCGTAVLKSPVENSELRRIVTLQVALCRIRWIWFAGRLGIVPDWLVGGAFSSDAQRRRIASTATVWGTKAKPSVSPKPRRLCCLALGNVHALERGHAAHGFLV